MMPCCDECERVLTIDEYRYWMDNRTTESCLCDDCRKDSQELQTL